MKINMENYRVNCISEKRNYKLIRQKEAIPFTGCEYICIDLNGIPFEPINNFIKYLASEKYSPINTLLAFTRQIISYFTYLDNTNQIHLYTSSVVEVERLIRGLIQDFFHWKVEAHREGNYVIKKMIPLIYVKNKRRLSKNTLRQGIQALSTFYSYLINKDLFNGRNPIEREWNWSTPKNAKINQAPAIAGITEVDPFVWTTEYKEFCVQGKIWKPEILTDPAIKRKFIDFFKQGNIVYLIITLILFESGARIHEVLSVTKKGWESLHGQSTGAKVINKGSDGELAKKIYWLFETDELIKYYVKVVRPKLDRRQRSFEELRDDDVIFLNQRGDPITRFAFYAQWNKAREKIGVQINIHQVRHWFVTMALMRIDQITKNNPTLRFLLREEFFQLMSWKNQSTMQIYDHRINQTDLDVFNTVIRTIQEVAQGPVSKVDEDAPTNISRTLIDQIDSYLEENETNPKTK
jgi:site-specific recombinase XerD